MTAGRPVMILAGGTGGHVYPALAVAYELRGLGHEVVWMGTRNGLEARVVPAAGIPMTWLKVSGLRGKGALAWLLAPARLLVALAQAFAILWRCRPRAVLGMGGFTAGPGGLMAVCLRCPLIIHEQNAIAGLTNRWLAPLARRVLEGFPGTFKRKATHTGNPVRAEITALEPPERRFAGRKGPIRLLALGGSQGARALNTVLPEAVARLSVSRRPEIWQQTGPALLEAAREAYRKTGVTVRLEPFIDDMAAAYGWADLVLCRSGALTVAELAAAGVGAILVPFPHAVDDHQTANGRFLADCGAARLIPETDLAAARLANLLEDLGANRPRLLAMAMAARRQAQPQASRTVAEICLEAAGGDGLQAAAKRGRA